MFTNSCCRLKKFNFKVREYFDLNSDVWRPRSQVVVVRLESWFSFGHENKFLADRIQAPSQLAYHFGR